MVTFIEAVILSFVQGITEWFPISSSGHIAIAQQLLGVNDFGFSVYLHFASVLGVVILFWKDIIHLAAGKDYKYLLKIAVAVIPAGLAGIYLLEHVRTAFENFFFMGVFFMIFGVFAYSTKYAKETRRKPNFIDSIYIGVAQVFSLFPGVSRSGMTMGSGLILGLKKEQAIRFSFLLAVPIIFGASLIEAKDVTLSSTPLYIFLTAFTITLLVSLLTIHYLIKLIKKDKFYLFGIYNFILGIILILWSFLG